MSQYWDLLPLSSHKSLCSMWALTIIRVQDIFLYLDISYIKVYTNHHHQEFPLKLFYQQFPHAISIIQVLCQSTTNQISHVFHFILNITRFHLIPYFINAYHDIIYHKIVFIPNKWVPTFKYMQFHTIKHNTTIILTPKFLRKFIITKPKSLQ